MAFEQPAPDCAGAPAQDRLESRLVDEKASARAERIDAFIQTGDDVGELLALERVHDDERAFRLEFLEGLLPNLVFDACGAKHFEGAHVKECGARQMRSAPQRLDRQRGNAMLREEHGHRQPDQAAAGQHRRYVFVRPELFCHDVLP